MQDESFGFKGNIKIYCIVYLDNCVTARETARLHYHYKSHLGFEEINEVEFHVDLSFSKYLIHADPLIYTYLCLAASAHLLC